jgi:hypothetical protein
MVKEALYSSRIMKSIGVLSALAQNPWRSKERALIT